MDCLEKVSSGTVQLGLCSVIVNCTELVRYRVRISIPWRMFGLITGLVLIILMSTNCSCIVMQVCSGLEHKHRVRAGQKGRGDGHSQEQYKAIVPRVSTLSNKFLKRRSSLLLLQCSE